MVYIYNGILPSQIKEQTNIICSNMDGPKAYHIKLGQREKDKYYMILLICEI